MMGKWQQNLIGILLVILSLMAFTCFTPESWGDNPINPIVPFDSNRWEITAKQSKVENYLGQQSLLLQGGFAVVKDSEFTDGIIEFDLAFTPDRGFMGGLWRIQDLNNFEKFYIRPHQSGNPDATQYTPVFNGITGWQLYGKGYNAPVKYDFDRWMHVKIVVSGKNAELYIKDMDKPILFVGDLKREIKPGQVGIEVEPFAPAHFANFSYTNMANPPLKGQAKAVQPTPPGTVMSWLVSSTFAENLLEGKTSLTASEKQGLNWEKLNSEPSGLANLARVNTISKDKNTVFAKTMIISDKDQIKQLDFGFSDRIKIYFNDELLYSGHDEVTSRDYRFLGTIGYYDAVYLPLKKGENELWMAVAEGPELPGTGWGLQAKFNNLEGISFKE